VQESDAYRNYKLVEQSAPSNQFGMMEAFMQNNKGIITGHFMSHWGVPKEIRPLRLAKISEFAILEFAPRGERKTWRYATNGMSNYAQCHPDRAVKIRSEVYGCTNEAVTWVNDLLAAISSYPLDFQTYFGEGDTINVGQPIDRNRSCFTAILLAPPGLCDSPSVGLVGEITDPILVHQVIGILPSEVSFAEQFGGRSLWERLAIIGSCALDADRPPIV
jgi:hypothetical protein